MPFFFHFFHFLKNYNFNLLTTYENSYEKYKKESFVYANSDDNSYFLLITNVDDNLEGKLYDLAKNKIHYFSVNEDLSKKNSAKIDFNYLKSKYYHYKQHNVNRKFKYHLTNKDSIYDYYNINFKNVDNKKRSLNLKVERNNYNLFNLFKISCIHPEEFNEFINIEDFKGIVVEAENEIGSMEESHKLSSIQETNFYLEVKN